MKNNRIVIGTRGSRLALWQSEYIKSQLHETFPQLCIELKQIRTAGDKILDVPLARIGDKGLFIKEIEYELLTGGIDLAVHSMKDVPTVLPDGLTLAAIPKRECPFDVLVAEKHRTLSELPPGAVIATSSLRRRAQLLAWRPDLKIVDVRGNIDTRLKKLSANGWDGMVLAAAGLKRLGLSAQSVQELPLELCIPATGQGALAVECRSADQDLRELLGCLRDAASEAAVLAERSFLHTVEGGCQIPVGAYGEISADGCLLLRAVIAAVDGSRVLRASQQGKMEQAEEIGRLLGQQLLTMGGRELIETACREAKG